LGSAFSQVPMSSSVSSVMHCFT